MCEGGSSITGVVFTVKWRYEVKYGTTRRGYHFLRRDERDSIAGAGGAGCSEAIEFDSGWSCEAQYWTPRCGDALGDLVEEIELNIVEERVLTSSFARDTTTTSRVPHSTTQSKPFGGGSDGDRGAQTRHQMAAKDTVAHTSLPSFAGQQQGPSCWTCGGDHMRRDCPEEAGGRGSLARSHSAQVVCDHCGRAGHPRDWCFDLHPELTSGGRDRGGDAPRGRAGRGDRGGRGAGAVGRTATSATSATESTMAARIEQLELRLVAMASSGASTSTSYEEENFSYLASAAQVEALVAVTRGDACASKPRVATVELDPQKDVEFRFESEARWDAADVGRSRNIGVGRHFT
ncbi:hypothetical protein AXG93_4846s1050 [Marchantia polymorpha subsp. ruderalis]|uniref:CCHC-type domain-containing protein n=1 Tax=Marchantia polymorpha subsp. ruderalis TaxID=1480154 RepID=A0A176VFL3_MARPO|nr:hypothetical protein AXG93_4846s1050 [Marchantia polymorpha subsp. ruderalis]